MQNHILLINNNDDLKAIEKNYPELINMPLILLSSYFSDDEIVSYQDRGYTYYDEYLDEDNATDIHNTVHHIQWDWFLSNSNRDVSVVNGCSLGVVFVPSMQVLLSSVLKYLFVFEKLLNKNSSIYLCHQTDSLVQEVLFYLQKINKFSLEIVTESNKLISADNAPLDVNGDYRKHDFLLNKRKWTALTLQFLLNRQHLFFNKRMPNVLFMPAGKNEVYFQYIKNQKSIRNFNWIISLHSLKDIALIFKRKCNFFYFSSERLFDVSGVNNLISKLKGNILSKKYRIDSQLLVSIMDNHIFNYFQGAVNYYHNSVEMISCLQPKLLVLSSESHESFLLVSQAAKKNNIKIALLPHGMYGTSRPEFKVGRFKWIDYGFSFGNLDKDIYLNSGLKKEDVYITGHPYFESFIPARLRIDKSKYKRAILLPPDMNQCDINSKIYHESEFYKDVCLLMQQLNIEIVGIKVRDERHLSINKMKKDTITVNGKKIPILVNCGTFVTIINDLNVDLVVGGNSTAIMEIGLLGVDYYVYERSKTGNSNQVKQSFYKYLNVSHNVEKLKENILGNNPYSDGYSVNDLIDISGIFTQEGIFQKLEEVVETVVKL
jgi:hypothetical protein